MLTLGVDGGGSGCRAALAAEDGTILARAERGAANIVTDFDAARTNILEVCKAVLGDRDAARVRVGMGLAGANLADAAGRLAASLPFPRLRIETDAVAAAVGALAGADGIVATIGTGSVFARVDAGRVRQIGGWGFILGDEGSGAVLGRAILAAALRAHDGHAPVSPLLADLMTEFGGPEGMVAFARSASPGDFARLAPRVAGSGDPAAEAVMKLATHQVEEYILTLRDGSALPVVFTGGLGPVYRARLAHRGWPLRDAVGTALDGALRIAEMAG